MSVQSLWNKFRFSSDRISSMHKNGQVTPRPSLNKTYSTKKDAIPTLKNLSTSKGRPSTIQHNDYSSIQSCSETKQYPRVEQISLSAQRSAKKFGKNVQSPVVKKLYNVNNDSMNSSDNFFSEKQQCNEDSKIIIKDYLTNKPETYQQIDEQNQILRMKCMQLEQKMIEMAKNSASSKRDEQQIDALVQSLESKVNQLIDENERLNAQVEQNDQWKTKYETLQYIQQRIAGNVYYPQSNKHQEIPSERPF